jgi:hypothetical protein
MRRSDSEDFDTVTGREARIEIPGVAKRIAGYAASHESVGQTSSVGSLGVFVIWIIAGSLGPIALVVGLLDGRSSSVWIGLALCCVWALDLGFDWLAVRTLTNRDPRWNPWEPKVRQSRS